jgi:cation:H+ antiporter
MINTPIIAVPVLIAALSLMIFSAKKVIDHSVVIASAFGIPPLIIGLVFISLGTDFPEIVNSIISSSLGHVDINIGDSIGSVLIQLTLVFGIFTLIGGAKKILRKEVIVIGSCLLLALGFLFNILQDGTLSRLDAFTIVSGWILFTIITIVAIGKKVVVHQEIPKPDSKKWLHTLIVFFGLIGVGVGSFFTIESTVFLATFLKVPEFYISFFVVGLGTSLPELVVDLTAIRKKQFDIAIGDVLGSCLIDATISIGIGPLLFPQKWSANLANRSIIYTIAVAIIVISLLAIRGKVDRKFGVLLIVLYAMSFLIILIGT